MSRLTSWFREPDIIIIKEPLSHISERYMQTVTVPTGFACDGATFAPDKGNGWKFHDWLFYWGKFTGGDRCTFTQANMILYDVMKEEGYWIAARFYIVGVFSPFSRSAWNRHRASEIRKINHRKFKHALPRR